MSGISGWADFDRDLAGEVQIVRAMADRLSHRGPDGQGEWINGHAALAHRRLAHRDLEGGLQPAIYRAQDSVVAVLVLDGTVTNHRQLLGELGRAGHQLVGYGDAEVALHAFLEWGPDFAAHLEGLFAIALWDEREQELHLIRDRLGIKPLYYYPTPSGILFGSEPKALLAHPSVVPVVNADGLRELFAHSRKPGTGIFRGMHEVLPAQVLTVSRSRTAARRYWSLPAWRHEDSLPDTIARVRELLSGAVAAHQSADVEVGAMLSGGVDSSALVALAAGSPATLAPGALRTFSVNFTGYTENFEPLPTMRATPDAPFAKLMASHAGTDHQEILLDVASLSDPRVHEAVLRSQDVPTPLGDMDASLMLFFAAMRKQGITAVLSGETADEVFNGYFWAYDPAHSNSETFPWISFERGHDAANGGLGCSLVDLGLRKELAFLEYADQHYRDALTEVPYADGEDAAERRAREITYLALTRWAPTHLDRADRLSMAHGVQLRPPFCDHALVEYVYNVPASLKRANGQEKSLLRSAVADLLPEQVLNRRKSAYPTTQERAYGQAVRDRFAEIATDPNAPVAPLLDAAATQSALAKATAPSGAFAWVERANMEMILQLNTWLIEYHIEFDV
jgi:asparagine synthase (glutamine-hydrolysing)